MMDKVTKAIEFAARAHDGMTRKKEKVPFILHPLEAATIVGSITGDEDVISAALLHDVVEDTEITAKEIKDTFGERIAFLVASETENKREELPSEATWKIRKEESLKGLAEATDRDVLILWLGDKLSNMRSFYRQWLKEGDEMWKGFNEQNPREQEWYYSTVAELTSSLSEYPVWQEYNKLVKTIFGKED